jgi:uncharacterized protein (DUF39 family)
MTKSIQEINEKIKQGRAVVVTAEEVIQVVKEKGLKQAAAFVDVVTTGTFAPMCSSGAYFNVGHATPRIKLGGGKVTLNEVPAYAGFAAVDILMGATAIPDDDPRNKVFPGKFAYGGGHVIEDLVAGKDVRLTAATYGTDCYPRKTLAPCPTRALYVDRATMTVGFDEEKCIACELCLNVCPYRAVEIAVEK